MLRHIERSMPIQLSPSKHNENSRNKNDAAVKKMFSRIAVHIKAQNNVANDAVRHQIS